MANPNANPNMPSCYNRHTTNLQDHISRLDAVTEGMTETEIRSLSLVDNFRDNNRNPGRSAGSNSAGPFSQAPAARKDELLVQELATLRTQLSKAFDETIAERRLRSHLEHTIRVQNRENQELKLQVQQLQAQIRQLTEGGGGGGGGDGLKKRKSCSPRLGKKS
jgi:hypothetical protein